MVGAVAWLGAGCGENPQNSQKPKAPKAPPAKREVRKPKAAESKPAKPVKSAVPGKIVFLDFKSGFRDATLGDGVAKFENLVLVRRDEARELETYTRTGDVLAVENMPLTAVEYVFFRGQLAWISLKWKMEYDDSPSVLPPPSDMPRYCANLYGPPSKRSRSRSNDLSQTWRGRRTTLVLNESRLPGVPDLIRSRWGIPPTTIGELTIESVALRQSYADAANKLLHTPDGL